jgi:hypothetical protein
MTTRQRIIRHSTAVAMIMLGASRAEAAPSERNTLVLTTPVIENAYSRTMVPGRDLVLHQFAVEAVREDGTAAGGTQWRIVVYVVRENGDTVRLALLDDRSARLDLPSPLGLGIRARDSLGIRVESDSALRFRIIIGYEADESGPRRFRMESVSLALGDAASGWTWQAPSSGRIMAFAGAALQGARELLLQDESGVTVWRERLHARPGTTAPRPGGLVQLGAVVEAGRTYRLIVVRAECSMREGDGVQALVLPVAAVAMR